MRQAVLGITAVILLLPFLIIACGKEPVELVPHVTIVAEGLLNPVGLTALPDGTLLIAEEGTGNNDFSAGVSLITPDGQIGRLISGLPSSRDAGDLSGVPLVKIAPDGATLYLGNFDAGHLWTLPLTAGETLSLPSEPFTPEQLGMAMQPLNNVKIGNPFDITFDADGVPVVSDATENGVAKETTEGTTRFFHRFDELIDPTNENLTIDPVPTGIERVGAEYYVTLFGGCPYPLGSGELVAISEERTQRTVIDNLNMPIDVVQDADGTIWVLEFAIFTPDASCFSGAGYQQNTGVLNRLNADGTLEPVVKELNFPGAVLAMPDGSFYVTEVFNGRLLHITFGPANEDETVVVPEPIQVVRATETAATSPSPFGWQFINATEEVGLNFTHGAFANAISKDPAAMMGGGLCWLDYDNDGWLDLYLVNSYANEEVAYWQSNGGLPQNGLFRNVNGRFQNVSEPSNSNLSLRGNGCVAADFNNDGWTDIHITADAANALLWNNGDGTFSEGGVAAGVDTPEWNSVAVVADLNGDGWPDLFVGSFIDLDNPIPHPTGAFPQDYFGLPDHLYLNNGDGTFRDVTELAGLVREERALGAVFSDMDNDGDLDLYIANDGQPNRLYLNEPMVNDPENLGFRFVEKTHEAEVGDAGSGMGIASGDYDNDGQFDLFVTNWEDELNAIYRNETAANGSINFRYSTYRIGMRGMGNNMTSWGTTWADFDHDTDLDLLTVNGRVPITNWETDPELVRLYGNRLAEGHGGEYREWTQLVGLSEVGPLLSRGSAVADFDNDGDLDVAINQIGQAAVILRNEGGNEVGNWLEIGFDGFYPGTAVTLTLPDGQQLLREWHTGSSYLASEDPRLHFGLGDADIISEITVRWPDGAQTQLENILVNQLILIEYSE